MSAEPLPLVEAAPPELRVETVADESSFVALETVWNWLAGAAGVEHPFLRHEWVRAAWDCFGRGHELRVLVARAGAEPVAIAPLMLGRARMYGLRTRQLGFIGNVHTPRFDLLVARPPRAAVRAIWQRLAAQADGWDVLCLRDVPESSPTLRELDAAARDDGFLTGVWRSCEAPVLPLTGSFESYAAGLKRKHRSNLRNRFKRLGALGPVDREVLCAAEPEALAEAFSLEAKGWKGECATAIQAQAETAAFYRRVAEAAARQGWFRLHFLRVGGRRVAFQITLECERRIYLLKLSHDPALSACSPQSLLCWLVLEDAFRRGVELYEFLGAREPWKLEWARECVPHVWLFVFPNSWRGRLLHRVKFGLFARLQRQPLYLALRDRLFAGRRGRTA